MVMGLDKFREYFNGFEDNYVVIGGTACDVILSGAGLSPRATKDIDIVIVVEALTKEFVSRFWEFVASGQYGVKEKGVDERKHYRFSKPGAKDFPSQLELFSRVPDLIELGKEMHLTPIPVGEGLSSLSAILMNDDYYALTLQQCYLRDGLKCANEVAIICLKVKAVQDLNARKAKGDSVSEDEVKKHRNDVFRIATMLTDDMAVAVPPSIKSDLIEFVDAARDRLPGPEIFKALGTASINPNDLIQQLERSFGLDSDINAHTDRKIAAVKRKLTGKDVANTRLSEESLGRVVRQGIFPLLHELEKKCESVKQGLFDDHERQIILQIGGGHVMVAQKFTSWPEIESTVLENLAKGETNLFMSGIDYNYQLRGFKKSLTFSYATVWLQFQFSEYSYTVRLNQDHARTKIYSYDAPLPKAEIDLIVGELIDRVLLQINEAGGLLTKS